MAGDEPAHALESRVRVASRARRARLEVEDVVREHGMLSRRARDELRRSALRRPDRRVLRLARAKAAAVAARRPADWVLAADTIVEQGGVMLGKPADAGDAARMVGQLAGREHRVATGFALVGPGGGVHAAEVVLTRVRFRRLDARAIERYVASREGDDKAGAYAVQGFGAGLIESIEGSFTNVIGLPLVEVGRALEEAGLLAR